MINLVFLKKFIYEFHNCENAGKINSVKIGNISVFELTWVLNFTFRNRSNAVFKCNENSILSECHSGNNAKPRNHREPIYIA